jgi:hypothetical protein
MVQLHGPITGESFIQILYVVAEKFLKSDQTFSFGSPVIMKALKTKESFQKIKKLSNLRKAFKV